MMRLIPRASLLSNANAVLDPRGLSADEISVRRVPDMLRQGRKLPQEFHYASGRRRGLDEG
jgi:hypothetical protein